MQELRFLIYCLVISDLLCLTSWIGIKAKLLHLWCVTLWFFWNLYRAEWSSFSLVKKIKLFERSEFLIFRDKNYAMKVPDSLSGSQPFQELSCLLLLRRKEVREHHQHAWYCYRSSLEKLFWSPIFITCKSTKNWW